MPGSERFKTETGEGKPMEILVALILLLYALVLAMRMLVPGRAGDVFFGILARDFFWLFLRGLGVLIRLPFRILHWMICGGGTRRNHSGRGARRRRNRRGRNGWHTTL